MAHDVEIPSSWYQSVNPFAILVFAPIFAGMWSSLGRRRREPSTAIKMVMGLFLLGVGFVFMVLGGKHADTGVLVSPIWLLAAYTFHTLGELCLSPVGLSYVTKVAPVRFASLLMGVWFLANAVANKIAGALAAFTPTPGRATSGASERARRIRAACEPHERRVLQHLRRLVVWGRSRHALMRSPAQAPDRISAGVTMRSAADLARVVLDGRTGEWATQYPRLEWRSTSPAASRS